MRGDSPKRCLFVCYGGGHSKMVGPVLKRLASDGDIECHVLALTGASAELRAQGFRTLGFADFVRDDDRQALAVGARLAAELPPGGPVSVEESAAYLGLSYRDLVDRVGESEADRRYREVGRAAFLPISILERVFDALRPDLVVATSSPRAEKAALLVAERRGIPSLCLLDLLGADAGECVLPELIRRGYGTKVCVLTEQVKAFLASAGRPAEDVLVTGNPAFDKYADPALAQRAAAWRAARRLDGCRIILWASHSLRPGIDDPRESRGIDPLLLALLPRHPDWHLVIRPHPGESLLPQALPERATLSDSRREELPPVLASADVVVTKFSTVGLEGLVIGKPLVTLDFLLREEERVYSRWGFSIPASTPDAIEPAIERALRAGRPTTPFAAGAAADRIRAAIRDLVLA